MVFLSYELSELMKRLEEKMKKESADGINGIVLESEPISVDSLEKLQAYHLITGFFFNFEGKRVFSYAFTHEGKYWLRTH